MKKSKSFASAIRKRFSRPKKPRSHSADRAGSLRDANLLKPPENATKTTGMFINLAQMLFSPNNCAECSVTLC